MITIDHTIGFSIGTAVGFIIREVIGDKLARKRTSDAAKDAGLAKAATEFNNSFADTIRQIKAGGSKTDIIKKDFPLHYKAMSNFKRHLTKGKLASFTNCWDKYQEWHDKRTNICVAKALTIDHDDPEYIRLKNLDVLQLIEDLIQFAKIK